MAHFTPEGLKHLEEVANIQARSTAELFAVAREPANELARSLALDELERRVQQMEQQNARLRQKRNRLRKAYRALQLAYNERERFLHVAWGALSGRFGNRWWEHRDYKAAEAALAEAEGGEGR